MAIKTLYFGQGASRIAGTNFLATAETNPGVATTANTWTPSTTSANQQANIGTSADIRTLADTPYSAFTNADKPASINNAAGLGNMFRSLTTYTNIISAAVWKIYISFFLISSVGTTAYSSMGQPHRFRINFFASPSATGATDVRLLSSSTILTNTRDTTTAGTSADLSATWSAPEIRLEAEYLFFGIAFEMTSVTSTGGAALKLNQNNRRVALRQGGSTRVETGDFLPLSLGQELVGMVGI